MNVRIHLHFTTARDEAMELETWADMDFPPMPGTLFTLGHSNWNGTVVYDMMTQQYSVILSNNLLKGYVRDYESLVNQNGEKHKMTDPDKLTQEWLDGFERGTFRIIRDERKDRPHD